jgi:hypothetical protein
MTIADAPAPAPAINLARRRDLFVVRISAGPGESFLDKMIALVEGARRQRTPNEIALTLVLTAFTLIFMIVVVPLWPMALNAEQYMTSYLGLSDPLKSLGTDVWICRREEIANHWRSRHPPATTSTGG